MGDFMGVNSPILRPILEGPPAHNPYCWRTDLADTGIRRNRRRRSLPIRPYLHTRIPRITVVEQLPQIIMIIIIIETDVTIRLYIINYKYR